MAVLLANVAQPVARFHNLVYVSVRLLVFVIRQVHSLDLNISTPQFRLHRVGCIDFLVVADNDVLDRVRRENGIGDGKGRIGPYRIEKEEKPENKEVKRIRKVRKVFGKE